MGDVGLARGLEVGRLRVLHPGPLRWLRALGWMVVLFILTMIVSIAAGVTGDLTVPGGQGVLPLVLVTVISAGGVALYAGAVRLGEKRWPEEFALGPAALDLVGGLAIGAAMMTAVMGGLLALGVYQISGFHAADPMVALSMAVSSGATEELVMRAVIFRLLMRAFGVWPALGLSAALFGAMHLGNPNASPTAAFAIAVEAGLMLAGFYLVTGRVWMSIAVHAGWNFVQGYVFGAPVSGLQLKQSLLVSHPVAGASDLLSGGPFGPEASLPAMAVGTLVAAATLVIAGRRGRLKARADDSPAAGTQHAEVY
jgi:membrane protease YdiL (CAAX protease family)